MSIEIFDCEQNSDEWLRARMGIPTSSEFATVISEPRAEGHLPSAIMDAMVQNGCTAVQLAAAVKAAKKKGGSTASVRRTYMYKLAGEIITGEPMKSYSNDDMERGKIMEDEARDFYCFTQNAEAQRIGFVRNGDKGCSPDSFIGTNGMVEIKTALPHVLIDLLVKDKFPPEHKAQCQGALWVCEREWIDIICYWRGVPKLVKRATRDDVYISNLAGEVARFNDELAALVERVRSYGKEAKAA